MRAVFSDRTRNAVLPNSRMVMIRPAILTCGFSASSSSCDFEPCLATTWAMVVSTSAVVGKGSYPRAVMRSSFSRRTRISSDSGTSGCCDSSAKVRGLYLMVLEKLGDEFADSSVEAGKDVPHLRNDDHPTPRELLGLDARQPRRGDRIALAGDDQRRLVELLHGAESGG